MQQNSLVSIIMNCHNGQRYLKYSLKSIFNQTYKNWELIFGIIYQPTAVKKFWTNSEIKELSITSQKIYIFVQSKKFSYIKSERRIY